MIDETTRGNNEAYVNFPAMISFAFVRSFLATSKEEPKPSPEVRQGKLVDH